MNCVATVVENESRIDVKVVSFGHCITSLCVRACGGKEMLLWPKPHASSFDFELKKEYFM
jgi:hypothetical protein